MATWGGRRPGAGRKPNPDRGRKVAVPKLNNRVPVAPTIPVEPKSGAIDPRIWASVLDDINRISKEYARSKARTPETNPFRFPAFPKAAIPNDPKLAMDQHPALKLAMDDASSAWTSGAIIAGLPAEGLLFLGYTYLAELAQRPEYRLISETIADDATRKWIDFDLTGDEQEQAEQKAKDPKGFVERMADPDQRQKRLKEKGKLDKVKQLKDDQLRLQVQQRFYDQARNDGFFGRSHLYLDIRTDPAWSEVPSVELKQDIGDGRSALSKSKCPQGGLAALRTIEPVWTYPLSYNANNPLREDWYNPQVWYVMGQEIHGSRIPCFIGHPVPDILKPAYSFGGLSMSQMAKPYVDIWLQTRQSVADLIRSFSIMVLKTDLQQMLQPNAAGGLMARVAMFNMLRDNQGMFVVNKNTEDFANVSAPLSGLHELQAQAQEHLASVSRIPLVKLTGISPSGLNATSEQEIEVYDDTIAAYQKRFFDVSLRKVINFEMLSLWGEVDPEITHRWEPLRPLSEAEKGQKQKDDADRDQKYVDMGAISPGEVRARLINDADLPYTGLDPDQIPEPPAEEGLLGPGGGGAASEFEKEADGDVDGDKGGEATDADLPFASDAAIFEESKHPRAPDGKFGAGGSGAATKPKPHRLTPTEKAYLDSYSGDEFLRLNNRLRAGDASGPAVAKLDSAIGKSTIPAGTKLYRGISKEALKKMISGDVIESGQILSDPGFLSTSSDRNIAGLNSVGGVLMEIEVGEGQRGLDISSLSRNQHEKEVILPRNSKMKVLGLRAPKNPGDPIVVRVATKSNGYDEFEKDAADSFGAAMDEAKFEESKHPRAPDGEDLPLDLEDLSVEELDQIIDGLEDEDEGDQK